MGKAYATQRIAPSTTKFLISMPPATELLRRFWASSVLALTNRMAATGHPEANVLDRPAWGGNRISSDLAKSFVTCVCNDIANSVATSQFGQYLALSGKASGQHESDGRSYIGWAKSGPSDGSWSVERHRGFGSTVHCQRGGHEGLRKSTQARTLLPVHLHEQRM